MTLPKLYDLIDPENCDVVHDYVNKLLKDFTPDFSSSLFHAAFKDVARLFAGQYPGFRESNTSYHDFPHTCSVVLAQARLICGAMADGSVFDGQEVTKGMLAALFHDVGLIQEDDDRQGTGAKYTIGHEVRSIAFMRANLGPVLDETSLDDIADCIRCTELAVPPSSVVFRTDRMRDMGFFLGTADLLAQMADRRYLEKLSMLFEEFEEAGMEGYGSAIDVLRKTSGFYKDVVRKRLDNELGGSGRYMRSYFRVRYDDDRDLYAEAIEQNLTYLDALLPEVANDPDILRSKLRRKGQ